MKQTVKRRFMFAGRSMLWSLLLYVLMMLAFNWDEIARTIKGTNAVTIVTHPLSVPLLPGDMEAKGRVPVDISAGGALLRSAGGVLRCLLSYGK